MIRQIQKQVFEISSMMKTMVFNIKSPESRLSTKEKELLLTFFFNFELSVLNDLLAHIDKMQMIQSVIFHQYITLYSHIKWLYILPLNNITVHYLHHDSL